MQYIGLERIAKENDPRLSYLALLGVQAFFGSLPVVAKIVLAEMPSFALVAFRVGITAIVLLIFQTYRRRVWLKEHGDYLRLAVLSLFGVVLNQMLFIGGLSLTKAANASLLAVTIPIFTLAVGAIIGSEKMRRFRLLGVILAAIGVLVLLDPRRASFSSDTTIGDLLIVLNSLSFGIYVATSKEVVTRNGAFRSMMWLFLFASIVCVPVGLGSLFWSGRQAEVSGSVWGIVLYISLFATAVPYLLNAWALARVPPSTVAVFIYLQPLIGFILAVLFLGETIGSGFIVAAALIFVGLYFASRGKVKDRIIVES